MNLQTLVEIIAEAAGKRFDFPTQQIAKELIFTARAALIRRQYEQTGMFPSSALIQLCLDTVQKSSTECCGVDLGCKVTVSSIQIPVPIDVKDQLIFNYVGSIDGMKEFGYLKPAEIPYVKYRRLSKNLIYYTWINRVLMFINAEGLEKVKLIYVPANPEEALSVSNCSGKPCIDLTDNTFIEDHWEDAITKMVLPKISKVPEEQISVDENKG
jgi:hypothetical protein